jgi:cobalt-zinc-cadmium efflux system outer membrane protein
MVEANSRFMNRLTMKTVILVVIVGVAMITYASEAKCQNAGGRYGADTPADQARETASDPQVASLQDLTNEALQRSPMLVSARKHWEALAKVPRQVSTLPDLQIGLQHFTVGSPQPFSGYETSDFYYTGFGFSQDIPGPGKLGLRAEQARQEAEAARNAFEVQQRQVVEQVRETYFNLFYLKKTLDVLLETQHDLRSIAQNVEAQYHVGMVQQQDVLKVQLTLTQFLDEIEMHHQSVDQSQATLKALVGREQDSPTIAIADITPTEFSLDDRRLRQLGLSNSPTLKQAEAMEEASQTALALAKRDYIPDFTVGYTYEKTGVKFKDYYMLTLGAKVPLYFWRKQTPAVEQSALENESARANASSKRLSVMADLQNRGISLRTTQRVLKLYSEGLIPQAEATRSSALAAYRVNKVDFQTLLSAVTAVLRMKQEYYRTLADHEIAVAKIREVIGEQS